MTTFHKFKVFGHTFELPDNIEFVKNAGKGSYGMVAACKDKTSGASLAVKKIGTAFDDSVDCKRLLREIRLLNYFSHENILKLHWLRAPPAPTPFTDIYVATELMDTDLYQIIMSSQSLTDDHYQYFLYQMLRGLKVLHSANVIHRDMKPSNLLVNENCDLKICDFGLARFQDPENSSGGGPLTQYVVTRWYRPPELLLNTKEYTQAIDIWSVGCILAEIVGRRPLFPGKDYLHQLCIILDVIGTPSEADLKLVGDAKTRNMIRKLPVKRKIPFSKLYPKANPLAVDLLEKMLVFDPKKRITVDEALKHPYLKSLHDPTDEPESAAHFDVSWEAEEDCEVLRKLILEEVKRYVPEETRLPAASGD